MTGALAARRAVLVALLLALAALLVVPSTASAAPGQVVKEDATGAVFDGGDVTYTVTGGTVTFLFHLSSGAAGGEHVTVRLRPPASRSPAAPTTSPTTSPVPPGSEATSPPVARATSSTPSTSTSCLRLVASSPGWPSPRCL